MVNSGNKAGDSISNRLPLIVLLGAILFSVICRLRLLGVPLDRDEGEYAYVGQQLLHGVPPFVSIYHVKLPGIYVAYASIMAVFGQTDKGIHTGLLVVNVLTIILIYLIGKRIFNPFIAAASTVCFALFTMSQKTQGFSANAEHFVLINAMLGIWLMLYAIDLFFDGVHRKAVIFFFLSGIFLGISYTMKQHGLFFIAFAGLYFLYKFFYPKKEAIQTSITGFWKNLIGNGLAFGAGVLLPFTTICLVFLRLHLFQKFWWWTWYYPRVYISQSPWTNGVSSVKGSFEAKPYEVGTWQVFWPMMIVGFIGLIVVIMEKERDRKVFMGLLIVLSLIAVCISFNFYPHYYILAAPAIAFLVATGAYTIGNFFKKRNEYSFVRSSPGIAAILLIVFVMIISERNYLFAMKEGKVSQSTFGSSPFCETAFIGKYIGYHTTSTDKIAVIGSEPQIYFYANRRAATGYVYTYEMMREHPYVHQFQTEMSKEIESAKPAYIVMVNSKGSWFPMELQHTDSFIFNWSANYLAEHYNRTGILNIPKTELYDAFYCWDTVPGSCKPQNVDWIGIYKRKL